MKKLVAFAIAAVLLVAQQPLRGQTPDNLHIGAGVSVGLEGVGVDLVVQPVVSFLQVRAGFAFVPYTYTSKPFEVKEKELINNYRINGNFAANAKLNFNAIHLLADFYPFKSSSFHATVGAYFSTHANDGLVSISTNGPIPLEHKEGGAWVPAKNSYGNTGLEVKDAEGNQRYIITTDQRGFLKANLALGSPLKNYNLPAVYPYVGVGFGRGVAGGRVTFNFDLGVLYCGRYTLNVNAYSPSNFETYEEAHMYTVTREDFESIVTSMGSDTQNIVDIGNKVYNVLNKLPIAPIMRFGVIVKII